MIVDCHVHVAATMPGRGLVSRRLRRRSSFVFMRLKLGISFFRADEEVEREIAAKLVQTVAGTPELDAAVVLAFDGVRDADGRFDHNRTDLYVTNDYAAELARTHPRLLFGASVHPYRPDALAELERCVAAGAVLMKWLPVVQNIDPADDRCLPFYEALAHHRLPLLCHTGGEVSLPAPYMQYASPDLLVPALERGVTVIAAHCGTRSTPFETDFVPAFVRLANEFEHLHGDTAALNTPMRSYAYDSILTDDAIRKKLVHGSDWPIISLPPLRIGGRAALRLTRLEPNWMRRDVLIKRALGLDEAYWHRAATLLRLPVTVAPARGAIGT